MADMFTKLNSSRAYLYNVARNSVGILNSKVKIFFIYKWNKAFIFIFLGFCRRNSFIGRKCNAGSIRRNTSSW